MTFTANLPVAGLSNGRLTVLYRLLQAGTVKLTSLDQDEAN